MIWDYLGARFIAIVIFITVYFFFVSGWRSRTIAAMAGAAAMVAARVLPTNEMLAYIDFNAIGLLFGMMVLVGTLREANFFRVIGVKLANMISCKVNLLFLLFLFMTAFLSSLLDNVTTVLFMVAITIDISELLKINPKPFILGEIFASNIGGTSTLIGDPPNIMIASATGFSFSDFLENTAPVSIIATIVVVSFLYLLFRKQIEAKTDIQEIPLRTRDIVTDWRLFRFGAIMFIIIVAFFFTGEIFHLSPAAIAVAGAIILLFLGGPRMPSILEKVEWSTLIFFSCLFIIVGGLDRTGTLNLVATELSKHMAGNPWVSTSVILWLSSMASGFIDNISFVAAFIPIMREYSVILRLNIPQLWWALAIGAGFGGNATMIGASSNVVAIGVAESRGIKFSFREFLKIGLQITLISTIIANLMLILSFRL